MSHSLKYVRNVFEPGNLERVISFWVGKHKMYKTQTFCYLFPANIIRTAFFAQIMVDL